MNAFTRQNKPPGLSRENGRDGERLRRISPEEEKPEPGGGENEGKFKQVEIIQPLRRAPSFLRADAARAGTSASPSQPFNEEPRQGGTRYLTPGLKRHPHIHTTPAPAAPRGRRAAEPAAASAPSSQGPRPPPLAPTVPARARAPGL